MYEDDNDENINDFSQTIIHNLNDEKQYFILYGLMKRQYKTAL